MFVLLIEGRNRHSSLVSLLGLTKTDRGKGILGKKSLNLKYTLVLRQEKKKENSSEQEFNQQRYATRLEEKIVGSITTNC